VTPHDVRQLLDANHPEPLTVSEIGRALAEPFTTVRDALYDLAAQAQARPLRPDRGTLYHDTPWVLTS
jgi:hypothetical protein